MSPSDAANTPSGPTPPRANPKADPPTLKSTPSSRGTAVISGRVGILGVNVDKVRPWMEHDIEDAQQRPFDNVLGGLLQRASNNPKTEQPELLQTCLNAVLKICNAQSPSTPASGIRTALNEYVSSGTEKDLYCPFIEAANIAFSCLAKVKVKGMRDTSKIDIMCQQNDPANMSQVHQDKKSIRKPDVVIIPFSYNAFPDTENMVAPRAARLDKAREQPKVQLRWEDALACIEFKRPTKKELSQPKKKYEAVAYVPTKPEYMHVEAPVPDAPATAETSTSQTQSGQPAPAIASRTSARLHSMNASNQSNKRKSDEPSHHSSTGVKRPKIGDTERELDATVQTGLYAAEMFAANFAAKHVINLVVVDDMLWVWYYDRQGIIQSSGINFVQDLPRFLVLLYALQRFSPDDWGRNTAFRPDEKTGSHNITIHDVRLGVNVDLELQTSDKDRVTSYGLKGRATNVIPVKSKVLEKQYPHVKEDGMVAIFWAEEQRTSEPDILKEVAKIAERNPETVDGHVPELLWYHKFDESTSEFRKLVGVSEPTKGSRVLYLLVFRKLHPITELQGNDFLNVWQQCVLCHFDLWQGGVFHRDISPPNLMWRMDKYGKLIGVLNDYDLASLKSAPCAQGNERTGTLPFMALDLLSRKGQRGEVQHLYRHDLESFMWVLPWVCLRYRDGELLRLGRPLDEWATKDAQTVYKEKRAFLADFLDFRSPGMDLVIWSLVVHCLPILNAEDGRRVVLRVQREYESEPKDGGEITITEIERDDRDFLQLLMNIRGWVELRKNL